MTHAFAPSVETRRQPFGGQRWVRRLLIACVASVAIVGPVAAKPALRDVPAIDDGLFAVGLAHEIRKKCPQIKARYFKALGFLSALRQEALDLGYDADEISRHMKSDAEKQRLRDRAARYMQAQGFEQTTQGYCALGKGEIGRETQTGALLRATD